MDGRSEVISRTGIVDEDDVVFSVQTDSDGAVGFFALPVKQPSEDIRGNEWMQWWVGVAVERMRIMS